MLTVCAHWKQSAAARTEADESVSMNQSSKAAGNQHNELKGSFQVTSATLHEAIIIHLFHFDQGSKRFRY